MKQTEFLKHVARLQYLEKRVVMAAVRWAKESFSTDSETNLVAWISKLLIERKKR